MTKKQQQEQRFIGRDFVVIGEVDKKWGRKRSFTETWSQDVEWGVLVPVMRTGDRELVSKVTITSPVSQMQLSLPYVTLR